jgi:predicted SprT family Zn-dependent metalloprotease
MGDQEEKIQQALEDVESKKFSSYAQAAAFYNVPYSPPGADQMANNNISLNNVFILRKKNYFYIDYVTSNVKVYVQITLHSAILSLNCWKTEFKSP